VPVQLLQYHIEYNTQTQTFQTNIFITQHEHIY